MSQDSIGIFPHIGGKTGEISPHWLGEDSEVRLEKLKLVITEAISPKLLDTQVDFSLHASFLADSILCRVQGYIWAEQLARHIMEYPADWWALIKESLKGGNAGEGNH